MNASLAPSAAPAKKRDIHWYVFLHSNPDANEIVARALGAGADNEDRLRRNVECADKKSRDLWRVSFPEVRLIEKAGRRFNFKPTVYTQEGEGVVRVFVDPNIARRKKALLSKVKKANE